MYLFESGFSETDTIANNLSAIAAINGGFPDRSSATDNRAITQLIKGMFSTHPSPHKLHVVPFWDLVGLLSALSTPFSSQLIALQLSFKVVCLLAFQAGDAALSYIPCQGRRDIPGRNLVVSV